EKLIFITSEIDRLERLLFSELCEDLITYSAFVFKVSEHIATFDALLALARKVTQYNWVLPKNNSQNEIKIEKGWHPVLEQMDDKSGEPQKILKNDTTLTQETNMMLITGPNMSGKSTYMRQVALIVILAKIGSPVPATSATVGKINSVFTRIGSADDLFGGRSTFMVEMTETAKILNVADENSLVLIDEIGRGTSTADGLSLAWSIAEELTVSNKALSLFSTHYFELTNLPKYKKTISNFHIETIEQDDKIIFLYKLKKGSASKSFGLKVAKLAGISQLVIDKAFAYQNQKNTFFTSEQLAFHKPQTKEFQINYDFQKELSDLKIDEITPVKALLILQKLKESYSK
ncbi:MAG: DNA mismatch repair protein MutS, partial [Proteobacteria bacterium]|nr:DNA mismatch repair protein MutS [Pseudomonadota bacterium]